MSLIYIPQKVTANIAMALCQMRGIEFKETPVSKMIFQIIGDGKGDADDWHLVSRGMIDGSFSMSPEEIQEITKDHDFEWVSLRVLLFTIFARSVWTNQNISSSKGTIYFSCRDRISYRDRESRLEYSCHVMVSINKEGKLRILPHLNKNREVGAIVMKRVGVL
jgi:hypothetical protein